METKINMPAKRAELSLNFLYRARNMTAGSEKNHNKTKFFFLINWGKIYDFLKFCIEKSEVWIWSEFSLKKEKHCCRFLEKKHDEKNLDREIRTWYSLQCTINKHMYKCLIVYSCRIRENETLPNIVIYHKQHKEIKNTTVYIWKEKLNMYCVLSISSATHQTDVILKLKCE